MTRLVPLRRGARRTGDEPQRAVVSYAFGRPDRCTNRALPLHDLHSASGVDSDGEVYGTAWITRAALPAGGVR